MSVAAETSRTVLEIYQPLIVGFLAVSLGFVASASLEIWKDRIRAQRTRRELRHSLIFEFRMFRQSIDSQLKERLSSAGHYELDVYFPKILDEIKRMDIGCLSYEEICALANFTQMKERLYSIVADDEGSTFSNNYLKMRFGRDQNDARQRLILGFVGFSEAALDELEKPLARRLPWRADLSHLSYEEVFDQK